MRDPESSAKSDGWKIFFYICINYCIFNSLTRFYREGFLLDILKTT